MCGHILQHKIIYKTFMCALKILVSFPGEETDIFYFIF